MKTQTEILALIDKRVKELGDLNEQIEELMSSNFMLMKIFEIRRNDLQIDELKRLRKEVEG